MDHRRYGDTVYIRMDRGDEIIKGVLEVCKKEGISSAIFSGIGGCGEAQIQTFVPETGEFETRTLKGMLELVSLSGNVIRGEDGLCHHTHAVFCFKDGERHCVAGGAYKVDHGLIHRGDRAAARRGRRHTPPGGSRDRDRLLELSVTLTRRMIERYVINLFHKVPGADRNSLSKNETKGQGESWSLC